MGDIGTKGNSDKTSSRVHFEEFRMYLESAEKTTDRRLELNRSNASLSLLILAGIGAIASWSFGKNEVEPFSVIIVGTIALLAAIFCRWWWKQVISYKDLNSAKFQVLNEMAPRIVFPDVADLSCGSDQPFLKEWDILKEKQSLGSFKTGLALGASLSELTVPVTFMTCFLMITLTCVTMAALGRYDLVILCALGFG
ncbi:hypothetical protein A9Q95_14750 [Rhodobacterales bacterium 59_46_T64]|nr:hypothetical protein A9Q95_14750 [Rhodobacterales bacterium 59_46_T64]